jgi:hypothetical protein
MADVAMCQASDMFEMGGKVQVWTAYPPWSPRCHLGDLNTSLASRW